MLMAGLFAISSGAFVSCDDSDDVDKSNTLKVTPSSDISFKADGNEDVVLTIETDAETWSFEKSDWITAKQDGNTLTINAEVNTNESLRPGRITISAGNAKPVNINVTQEGGGEEPTPGDEVTGSLSTADDLNIKFPAEGAEAVKKTLTFTLEAVAANDVEVEVRFDEKHVAEYNFDNGTDYEVFPAAACSISNNGVLTIKTGETSGTLEVTINPSEELEFATTYMVPLQAVAKTEGLTVKNDAQYVDLLVSKASSKKIRNICYFEVNDCNPLNALEYLLEDGQPFFDAVVLFAGNINWDAQNQKVYMSANPNVQALLDNSEELLQPLRKKGIKVLLDILGNHDMAGVAGLTDYGCEQFGRELAQICLDYKLDGIGFDDEYSKYGGSNQWIESPSAQQAARLCYETKKAMKELCPWETWVHLYYLGFITSALPSVTIDGVEHLPGEFIDNVCADYGSSATPVKGMDKSGAAGYSVQLNRGYSVSEAQAKRFMDEGYGWIMWFAFDPSGTGSVSSNRAHSLEQFRNVAKACYEQDVVDPKNVYNKLGEGSYDPEPHPIN